MITIYMPALQDLWFRQQFMADEATMSYNTAWGGTIPFPETEWERWYESWLIHHENKRFYRYLKNSETNTFVGEIAYHYDEERFIWLADVIVRFATAVIPDQTQPEASEPEYRAMYISEQLFRTPAIAVQQTKNEIIRMGDIALDNFNIAIEIARTLDFSRRDEFDNNENQLNFLNRELAKYIAKLFGEQLSEEDRDYLSHALHSISDLERVGDYSTNIIEYAEKLVVEGREFSSDAKTEIEALRELIEKLFAQVMKAYVLGDTVALENAKASEAAVDIMTVDMSNGHVARMADGRCTPEVGAYYLALVSDAERVSDHFYNIAKTVKGL